MGLGPYTVPSSSKQFWGPPNEQYWAQFHKVRPPGARVQAAAAQTQPGEC